MKVRTDIQQHTYLSGRITAIVILLSISMCIEIAYSKQLPLPQKQLSAQITVFQRTKNKSNALDAFNAYHAFIARNTRTERNRQIAQNMLKKAGISLENIRQVLTESQSHKLARYEQPITQDIFKKMVGTYRKNKTKAHALSLLEAYHAFKVRNTHFDSNQAIADNILAKAQLTREDLESTLRSTIPAAQKQKPVVSKPSTVKKPEQVISTPTAPIPTGKKKPIETIESKATPVPEQAPIVEHDQETEPITSEPEAPAPVEVATTPTEQVQPETETEPSPASEKEPVHLPDEPGQEIPKEPNIVSATTKDVGPIDQKDTSRTTAAAEPVSVKATPTGEIVTPTQPETTETDTKEVPAAEVATPKSGSITAEQPESTPSKQPLTLEDDTLLVNIDDTPKKPITSITGKQPVLDQEVITPEKQTTLAIKDDTLNIKSNGSIIPIKNAVLDILDSLATPEQVDIALAEVEKLDDADTEEATAVLWQLFEAFQVAKEQNHTSEQAALKKIGKKIYKGMSLVGQPTKLLIIRAMMLNPQDSERVLALEKIDQSSKALTTYKKYAQELLASIDKPSNPSFKKLLEKIKEKLGT